MPGRAAAVISGVELQQAVENLGMHLGLEVRSQVRVGRRLWGSERKIDVVLIHPQSRRSLGLECKFQGGSGSADEKIPATISDIAAWPIQGLVVFAGEGFSRNMRSYLLSTGKAVEFEDLEDWLRLYFGAE
jgi:PD-(D/E)XK nuclease superfamily protein